MYSQNEKALIWLDLFDFLTYHKQDELLKQFNEPADVFSEFPHSYDKVKHLVSAAEFDKMVQCSDNQFLTRHIVGMEVSGIRILTQASPDYPKQFLNYAMPPLILYYRGDISLLKTPCVAVVGTRRMTRYGKTVTENIVKELVQSGVTIVSGLADGVDTAAHTTAVQQNGKTIAVLGSGLNEIYPHSNFALSKEIEKAGLILSESKPDTKPANFRFPIRNRIIAGLSKAVLITEAGIKSGVMYTRDYCAEYGIELFVVPGNITSSTSEGCNLMLKSCQGAICTGADDILEYLHLKNEYIPEKRSVQLNFDEQMVLNAVGEEEVHFDEILSKTKLEPKTLISLLTTLELKGIIKKLAGNYYAKD